MDPKAVQPRSSDASFKDQLKAILFSLLASLGLAGLGYAINQYHASLVSNPNIVYVGQGWDPRGILGFIALLCYLGAGAVFTSFLSLATFGKRSLGVLEFILGILWILGIIVHFFVPFIPVYIVHSNLMIVVFVIPLLLIMVGIYEGFSKKKAQPEESEPLHLNR